ncbi:MAG: bifunctional DNA-formamidopyrimidine glycosylase/DNA-(apurinic or apyrimidinic site) lyase [Planctomycetes bacterium]|nr:bifunctional DNA-formamidopyrimidine glycosylase/DNA-(apurinic or apyrimidinic site) lyase [Planctomycetota bacterium]
MPELPEVETLVRELSPRLDGARIFRLELSHPEVLEKGEAGELRGRPILSVARRGKYICLSLDRGELLTVHLRMTGRLSFDLPEVMEKHLRATFSLAGGAKLYFFDVRKFGRLHLWPEAGALEEKLGPEPLAARTVLASLNRCQSRRAIKAVLLDQIVLAGIGNIYADEALFASGIRPERSLAELGAGRMRRLAEAIPKVLEEAIADSGTTLSDYRRVSGEEGRHREKLKVYGRAGKPCGQCGTVIQKTSVAQRGTHYCPHCQR